MVRRIEICKFDEIPAGEMRHVDIRDGLSVAVFNVDGRYYATNNLCTHGVAKLTDGWLEGEIIECPQHGGCFNVRTGEATLFPCEKPLKTYPILISNGVISIDIDEDMEVNAE